MTHTLPADHIALRDSRKAQRDADLKLAYTPVFAGDPLAWLRWYAGVVCVAIVVMGMVTL